MDNRNVLILSDHPYTSEFIDVKLWRIKTIPALKKVTTSSGIYRTEARKAVKHKFMGELRSLLSIEVDPENQYKIYSWGS